MTVKISSTIAALGVLVVLAMAFANFLARAVSTDGRRRNLSLGAAAVSALTAFVVIYGMHAYKLID